MIFLQDLLKESEDLMMGVVNGIIPVTGHPGRTGAGSAGSAVVVTQVDFGGYKAEQKRILSVSLVGRIHY